MKGHGMVGETLPPCLPTLKVGAVVRRLLESTAARGSYLWSQQPEVAGRRPDCVLQGRNYTPSSSGCSSRNGLGDRPGQEGIGSSFADSVL